MGPSCSREGLRDSSRSIAGREASSPAVSDVREVSDIRAQCGRSGWEWGRELPGEDATHGMTTN